MRKLWEKYLLPTPSNVARWLMGIKGVLATAAGTTYFMGSPKLAFWIAIAIGVVHEITTFLTGKNDEPAS